jgi:hypothetical protein
MSNYKNFIHFGCWNYKKCDSDNLADPVKPEDTNITRVMKTLKKYIDKSIENKPEFLTVAGDNYYFLKNKKKDVGEEQKIFNQEFLLSGFNCLPKDIKKYVLIGNHDLENIDNPLKAPDCSILETQKKFESDGGNNIVLDSDRTGPIMHHVLDDSTIVIMLDTTMYEESEKAIKKVMKCYEKMFEMNDLGVPVNENVLEKIKVMRDNQKQRLADYIASLTAKAGTIKNIIVVGHHPLFDLKTKKDDESGKIKTKEEVMPLLNELYYESIYVPLQAVNSGIKYFYLCADLHQYQTGTVTVSSLGAGTDADADRPLLVIQQYIAGTGGTELEKTPYDHSKDGGVTKNTDKYQITYNIIPTANEYTHGFLVCKLDTNKNFSAEFIEADKFVGGGSYRKTRKTSRSRKTKKTSKQRKAKKTNKQSRSKKTKKTSRKRV